jgi:CubicO group peptidase (beta-lactamase class C family)
MTPERRPPRPGFGSGDFGTITGVIRTSELERTIKRAMRHTDVRGLSAALIESGLVVWSEGFGSCRGESSDRVTADTVFAVASLSKPPFAHLALRLCETGLLDLDTPLAEFDPEPYDAHGLEPQAPELRHVTGRHVLAHTSGLGNFEEQDVGPFAFPPGAGWRYSGDGYLYLQAVIEHLTGSPLELVADAEVFQPLGMTSTSYLWRPDGDRAESARDRCRSQGHEFRKAFAAWSLHTTAGDYARLVTETLRSEIGEALLTPQIELDEPLAWGLGWGLAGDAFWHWGDMGFADFQCVAVASRAEHHGLVCLTNSKRGLEACADILRDTMGEDYSYPIKTVLDRGW